MKIAIDARMLAESGIGRYIKNLLYFLQEIDLNNEYFILLLEKDFNIKLKKNFRKVLTDFRWYSATEQLKMPVILHKLNPDLTHFPHFNVPMFFRGKFVVTIHDLIHQHFQMKRATLHDPLTYQIKKIGYSQIFKKAINKSLKILVPSKYVKDLLINDWKIDNQKIITTYEAVDEKFLSVKNKISKEIIDKIIKKLDITSDFLFYVGNAHPHKNVEGLIKAFLCLREKYENLQLVLSGYDHYFWQRIKKEFDNNNIIYTGQVSDEQLVTLYKRARVFIMPSFEEGFGIPILEAMALGCPVIASNIGSLTEVGSNTALYFNPHDISDLVDKITQLLENNQLEKDLIKRGKERATVFSWKKLSKQTLEVYLQCG